MTSETKTQPNLESPHFQPVRLKNGGAFGLALEQLVADLPNCEFKQLYNNLSFKLEKVEIGTTKNPDSTSGDEIYFVCFRTRFKGIKKDIVILNDEETRSQSEFNLHFLSDAIASGNPLSYFDQETYEQLVEAIERDHTTIPVEESYPLIQRVGVSYHYGVSTELRPIVEKFERLSNSPYSFMSVTSNPHRGHYYPAMVYPALGIEIDVENLAKTIHDVFKRMEVELRNPDMRNRVKIYDAFDKAFEEIHYEINYLLTEKLRPSPVLSYENKVLVRRDRSKLWAKVSEPNSPLTEAYLVEAARFVSGILLTAAMALGNLVDNSIPPTRGLGWLCDKEKGFARPMEKDAVIFEVLVSIIGNNREYITHNDNIDSVVDAMAYTIKCHIDELIEKECKKY